MPGDHDARDRHRLRGLRIAAAKKVKTSPKYSGEMTEHHVRIPADHQKHGAMAGLMQERRGIDRGGDDMYLVFCMTAVVLDNEITRDQKNPYVTMRFCLV